MKRFRVLLAAAIVAASTLLIIAAPVSATPNEECDHLTSGNYFGIHHTDSAWITMVDAQIYLDAGRFIPCSSPAFTGETSGTSQWVAVGTGDTFNEIAQIGVIKCGPNYPQFNLNSNSPCYGSRVNTLRYFYAYGRESNCPGYGSKNPDAVDLGSAAPAQGEWHRFSVQYDPDSDDVWFKKDGVVLASVSADRICWISETANDSEFDVETLDPGDGCGYSANGSCKFDAARREINNSGTLTPTTFLSSYNCRYSAQFFCTWVDGDTFGAWTNF